MRLRAIDFELQIFFNLSLLLLLQNPGEEVSWDENQNCISDLDYLSTPTPELVTTTTTTTTTTAELTTTLLTTTDTTTAEPTTSKQ